MPTESPINKLPPGTLLPDYSVETKHLRAKAVTASKLDTTTVYGVATDLANVDHAAEAAGTSAKLARADHKHDVNAAAAGASAPGDSAAQGTATTLALSDHRHSREGYATTAELANVDASAESAGTSATVARGDHKHDISTAGPVSSAVGDTAANGTATSVSKSDHRHAREGFGSPSTISTANSAGTAVTVPHSDHVHSHGTGYLPDAHHAQAHGASDHTDRTRYVWLAPEDFKNDSATRSTTGATTAMTDRFDFADAAQQYIVTMFMVPGDWASGSLSIELFWAPGSVDGGDVRWNIEVLELASLSDTTAASTETAITQTAVGTTGQMMKTNATAFLTPSAAGNPVRLVIWRNGTAGTDTFVGTARLHGVRISYTADM